MEQQFVQQQKVGLNKGPLVLWGFITGLLMVVYSYLLQVSKVPETATLKYWVLAIFALGVVTYCFRFAKINNNKVTFGDVFKAGFQLVALCTLVLVSWDVVSIMAFPELKTEALSIAREQMMADKIPQETIEQNLKVAADKYTTMTIMMTVFSNVFYGVLFSAAGALLTKKNK